MLYNPVVYINDFWLLKERLVEVNDTVDVLNLTLHYDTYPFWKFITTVNFEQQREMQA